MRLLRHVHPALFLLVLAVLRAEAQERREPVSIYAGTDVHAGTLVRGAGGDTLIVTDSLAHAAVLSGHYDLLGATDRSARGKLVAGGLLAGFLGGCVWHLSEGGSLGSIINLFVDEEEDPILHTLTSQPEGPWRWRVAVGTLVGGLVGVGLAVLTPENSRVRIGAGGLTIVLAPPQPVEGTVAPP